MIIVVDLKDKLYGELSNKFYGYKWHEYIPPAYEGFLGFSVGDTGNHILFRADKPYEQYNYSSNNINRFMPGTIASIGYNIINTLNNVKGTDDTLSMSHYLYVVLFKYRAHVLNVVETAVNYITLRFDFSVYDYVHNHFEVYALYVDIYLKDIFNIDCIIQAVYNELAGWDICGEAYDIEYIGISTYVLDTWSSHYSLVSHTLMKHKFKKQIKCMSGYIKDAEVLIHSNELEEAFIDSVRLCGDVVECIRLLYLARYYKHMSYDKYYNALSSRENSKGFNKLVEYFKTDDFREELWGFNITEVFRYKVKDFDDAISYMLNQDMLSNKVYNDFLNITSN